MEKTYISWTTHFQSSDCCFYSSKLFYRILNHIISKLFNYILTMWPEFWLEFLEQLTDDICYNFQDHLSFYFFSTIFMIAGFGVPRILETSCLVGSANLCREIIFNNFLETEMSLLYQGKIACQILADTKCEASIQL